MIIFVKREENRQLVYREMLNSQVQFQNSIKMQGTMTAVEKKLNKVDLKAYKQGNKSVHSFIPGINHSNFGTQTKFHSSEREVHNEDKERENIRRMEMLGYTRGYDNLRKN